MRANFNELVGKILVSVNDIGGEMVFTTDLGEVYKLFHDQSCCESVTIEDINGDLSDLIGSPILLADESSNCCDDCDHGYESCTWTFYRLATVKGYVDIRWLGVSNGYYSESVDFEKITKVL